jgi:sulfur-oxidizing protein SoxY
MTKTSELGSLTRRQALKRAGALGAFAAAGLAFAPKVMADQKMVDEAVMKLIGDKQAKEGKITLDLPQIAENGNTVPVGVEVDSPMTEDDHVKAVHLFAQGNPAPEVGTFRFTPANGKAAASTRMRLAGTQDVVAVAEMSDGSVYKVAKTVKVTIGGCGG